MLLKSPLVNNGIEKLHNETSYFMTQIRPASKWSKSLFHKEFYDAVVSVNPALEARYKTFFKEFKNLPVSRKNEIIDEFTSHNSVRDLCRETQTITRHWCDPLYPKFAKAVNSLFVFMYEETLDRTSFKSFSGQSLSDHYKAYRQACASSMCPFCGLEDYIDLHPELEGRDAYDHYLYKAGYPFAAVNPANLFPMCHECNTRFKKSQDVLFKDDKVTRRRAAYPPDDNFDISIQIEDALLTPPKVLISLNAPANAQVTEKFNTWMSLLNIQKRYEGRVIKKKSDWLKDVVASVNPDSIETELQPKLIHEHEVVCSSLAIGAQREHHLKAPFLEYCITNVDSLKCFFQHDSNFAGYLTDRARVLATVA